MASQSIKVADIFAQFGFRIDQASMQRVNTAIQTGGANMGNYTSKVKRNQSAFRNLVGTMREYKGLLVAVAGVQIGTSLITATRDAQSMENALLAASGSQETFQKNNKFLQGTVDRLGLSLRETANDYTLMTASADGLFDANDAIANQNEIDKVFTSVAEASTVLGLSADKTHGTLLALTQIMSKGKVQSEELRGQLGERLPGAYRIAAEAMGMTTGELNKQLELGNISSKEFLPKFAKQLKSTFTDKDVLRGSRSLNANINKLHTSIFRAGKVIGEGGFNKGFTNLLGDIIRLVDRMAPAFTILGRILEFLLVPFRAVIRLMEGVVEVAKIMGRGFISLVEDLTGFKISLTAIATVLGMVALAAAIAFAPFTTAVALVTAVGLAVDEMWTYFQGGETMLGEFKWFRDIMDMFEKFPKLVDDAVAALKKFFSMETLDAVNEKLLDASGFIQGKGDEYLGKATGAIGDLWDGLMSDSSVTPQGISNPASQVATTSRTSNSSVDSSTKIDKIEINLKKDISTKDIKSEVTKGLEQYTQNKSSLKLKPVEG